MGEGFLISVLPKVLVDCFNGGGLSTLFSPLVAVVVEGRF